MLSQVSYVCLGMCVVMWVISGGTKFGRTGFVFHLGLAVPAFRLFLFLFDVLSWTCLCSFCIYFSDVFISLLCGRIFALLFPRYLTFYTTQCFIQVFLFLQKMYVSGPRTWLDSFSCISVSLCHLFIDWGEDSISSRVSRSSHCLASPIRWRAVSY